MNICTIIAKNYLPHARVLAESFREHHPDGTCSVLVIDDVDGYIDASAEPFELVTMDELQIEGIERMRASYEVIELSTAVKPWLLRHLLHEGEAEAVAYFDPDIQFFDSVEEIDDLMREHGLVLIPHTTAPMPRDGRKPSESDILIAGAYNLGFIGLAKGNEADKLLDWWSERLSTDCVVDPEHGYFVDQRWVDLVPGIVEDVHLLRAPGYNVAYWNLPSRSFERSDGRYLVDGQPLRFFHFSGFDAERPHLLSKYQDRISLGKHRVLRRICEEYADALVARGYREVKDWPYTYGKLPNGITLDRFMRSLYREADEAGELTRSIFSPEGAEDFLQWLNELAETGAHAGITRYLHRLYERRPDLQTVYPTLDQGDGEGYAGWVRTYGRHEVPIADRLLPPDSEHVGRPGLGSSPDRDLLASFGVNVAGYFRAELGVGEAARQLISALDAHRVPVAPVGFVAPNSRQDHEFAHLGRSNNPFPINIICVNADGLPRFAQEAGPGFFEDRYSIGLWWWEVSKFPERWRNSFEYLDEVWAATQHVVDAITPLSPIPVVKIPLPVYPAEPPVLSRSRLGLPEGFLFLLVFDYHSVFERKNPIALIEAFKSSFGPGSGASLVVKCINHEKHPANHERLLTAADDHPDVQVIDRYVSLEEKNAMIKSCDCYVSLHRSEGFGIPLAEAMYFGKPVIATGYSGNLDFMTNDNSYLVDYRLTAIGEDAFPYPPDGEWAEPDVEHAARLMRQVFDDQLEARERGARAAADIRSTHSPQASGEAIRQLLVRTRSVLAGRDRVPAIDVAQVRNRIVTGPQQPPRSRLGALRTLARRIVLRLVRPYSAHQRMVDEEILAATEQRVRRLEIGSAMVQGDILAALRRQDAGIRSTITRWSAAEDSVVGLLAETRAIPYMAAPMFEPMQHPVAGRVIGYTGLHREQAGDRHTYRDFEDIFRGSEEFIRERQRVYLDLLGDHESVLDAGCGRGEFLDLLREHGFEYAGVDLDQAMIERCRAKGHEHVEQGDANAYLETCADQSLGAIFSAQFIEHLSYDDLMRFFELSFRKLQPGGLLIAETVNPHSLQAMKAFWVDRTHGPPVFPEVALANCRISGFESAFVFHPNGTKNVEADRFQQGEYAIVATKGGSQSPASARSITRER
jgi:glycosyltransferase involved in cell wall biosynthesis/SAM-dependent methyltransferase